MTPLLTVAIVFVGFLVAFFCATFYLQRKLTHDQRTILRFLSSICAGFVGGLFTGDALFKLEVGMGGWNLVVSGAAGMALFFTIWFTFRNVLPDAINFSVPQGWTFQQTVDALVEMEDATTTYEGFTSEQLNARVRPSRIGAGTLEEAVKSVRRRVSKGAVPPYAVDHESQSSFRIVTEEGNRE